VDDTDLVIGLVFLAFLVAVPLALTGIVVLLAVVALCLGVFFLWGSVVNIAVRSLGAIFFKDNGHWWGFIEAEELLVLVLLGSGLVLVLPLAVLGGSYLVFPEVWMRWLKYMALGESVVIVVSLGGYFVTNWRYRLPYRSEIALRAEEVKIKARIYRRVWFWRQWLRLRWLVLGRD